MNRPITAMKLGVALSSLLLFTIGGIAADLPGIKSEIISDGLDRIRIRWASEPGEGYHLQSTTNLAELWRDLQTDPPVLTATTNQLTYELMATNQAQFFRVRWLDTDGPRLIPTYPRFEGIAVPRDSTLETRLWDPSGVDSDSIMFSLGDEAPIGLADSRLTYTNEVLTYRPLPGERLGDYGQQLMARVIASDQGGNRATNLWPFQLELQTILSTNILMVGGQSGRGPGLASADGLNLISRNGFLLVYRYEGASSGLRQGMHLIDSTPGRSYALTVLVFTEDPLTQTVSVWTQQAALADLIEEGSISTRTVVLGDGQGIQRHVSWDTGMDLAFEHTVPLQTILCQWRQGTNYVWAELTSRSQLLLEARAGFAANFKNFTLTQFEAYAGGRVELDLEVYAEGNYATNFEGSVSLITPVYGHVVIPVATVPVEVTTKFEVELPYELTLQAEGHLRNGIKVDKRIYVGRKWDGAWQDTSHYPSMDFKWSPVEWQVSGAVYARAGIKPKMTALIYGLVGPYGDLVPYLELEGWAQGNPWQYKWDLYGGLDAHLGCDLTVFDRLFPDLSFEQPFELLRKTRITGDNNLVTPPKIVLPPQDQTVPTGGTIAFSVAAEGTALLTYRWQHNERELNDDGRISGSRGSVLRIKEARQSDAGTYRVKVANSAGTATSTSATLTVTGGGGPAPSGMVLIPAGTFQMGDSFGEGDSDERPVHPVTVSGFYMDRTEVTKALWDEVYGWAGTHGYSFGNAGGAKGPNHPVHTVSWYDVVKWCNARSEREGRVPAYYTSAAQTTVYRTGQVNMRNDWVKWNAGYRLPTEAEWEYAARGGLSGRRFPWGDTISHSQANYYSYWERVKPHYSYDVSPTEGCHPTYATGAMPYTSPVGSFGANGYGLYDMAGNVWEWCWDWYHGSYYTSTSANNPRGPIVDSNRVIRGGGWYFHAWYCRVTNRRYHRPLDGGDDYIGFRSVLPSGQ